MTCVIFFASLLISFIGWDKITMFFGLSDPPLVSAPAEGVVQVHFIDVGQGDCALILTHEKAVLIDSGEDKYADFVIGYINKLGIKKLDLIIVSHVHSDHIGGIPQIVAAVKTDKLLLPRLPDRLVPTTNVFINMLNAVEEHSIEYAYAKAGDVFDLGNADIEILSPHVDFEINGINNSSIAAKLNHGGNSFLFTGDMEREAEVNLIERERQREISLSATVLKVAHHGSRTSSGQTFLDAVGGKYAVISVGSPNNYNHPTDEVLKRLKSVGFEILRTDESGTIVFESSEDGLEIKKEKAQ
ncbi:MAG: MBL fold metallo-hydrolase [Oscillospiraceae bacterium]|nr:MBL fold metallo-hydrolase [Oscillospiraceae bacterium]